MRHGFGIGYTGWANGLTIILLVLLVVAVITLIAFNSERFRKKNHPEHNKLLEILKEKYVTNEINADEYRERSMLIEDGYLDSDNPSIMILKERYANCEIDSREYVVRRDELQGKLSKSPLDVLRERYAKGDLSSEEFHKMKKTIL